MEDFILLRRPEKVVAAGEPRVEIFDALNIASGFAVDVRGQLTSLRSPWIASRSTDTSLELSV